MNIHKIRNENSDKRFAVTLAQILVALFVTGALVSVILPVVIGNRQEQTSKEQVRIIKYNLTQATDDMKSKGLLSKKYPTTKAFVTELKKYYNIAKVCDNSNIADCWPYEKISTVDGDVMVSTIKTGENLKSLGLGTKNTNTVGIITESGIPMIMTYSPRCTPLNPKKTYSWSNADDKPETNATTNCISAIFDINGKSGPNRVGKDVRTLNSIFGYKKYDSVAVNKSECKDLKMKQLVKACQSSRDYYAGAVKKCKDAGLHLPSIETLAVIAGATYGRTDIGPYTLIMSNKYAREQTCGNGKCTDCKDYYKHNDYNIRKELSGEPVCLKDSIPYDTSGSAIGVISGDFWSGSELSSTTAIRRNIYSKFSSWGESNRDDFYAPFCVGD